MHRHACTFCQKRKIACNKQEPCNHCSRRRISCVFAREEKRRPVNRPYTEALEGKIAFLENFISRLVAADSAERDTMLATFKSDHLYAANPSSQVALDDTKGNKEAVDAAQCQRFDAALATPGYFFGPTSIAALASSRDKLHTVESNSHDATEHSFNAENDVHELSRINSVSAASNASDLHSIFSTQSSCCRELMVLFFDKIYTHHMCLYRELFLRDYDAGGGPYYSNLLMYALCAMGGLVGTSEQRDLSELFAQQCETILFGEELEHTRFTTLQALLLMGTRAIGKGKNSKGWLFTGMAFRMIHEMGLHQDPAHWKISTSSEREREIFRRVYWASFVLDKQLSLFFGRPPALQTREADVRETIRIAYPPEWRGLLQKYIRSGVTESTYEDGEALVEAFVQKAELCKIIHRIVTEIFGRRDASVMPLQTDSTIQDIHFALESWRDKLPSNVHWGPHVKGQVQSYTLNLHMLYHTAVMVLHRPSTPLRWSELKPRARESLQICQNSLDMCIRLLRAFGKNYQYLPVNFVHTAATAASIILLGRETSELDYANCESISQLQLLVDALRGVASIWTCAIPIHDAIVSSLVGPMSDEPVTDSWNYDLLTNGLDYDQMAIYHSAEPFLYERDNSLTLEERFLNL